jgi:hypothetical protein
MSEHEEVEHLESDRKTLEEYKLLRGSLLEGVVWGLRGHLAFTMLFIFLAPIAWFFLYPGTSFDASKLLPLLSTYCYALSILQIFYMLPMILIFAKKKKIDSLLGTLLLWMSGIILFMGSGFTLCTLSMGIRL